MQLGHRLVSTSFEFTTAFQSPQAIDKTFRLLLNQINTTRFQGKVKNLMNGAKKTCQSLVPNTDRLAPVRDWRVFLYREYGLAMELVEFPVKVPKRPSKTGQIHLPPEADPPKCRRGVWPRWFRLGKEKDRNDKVYEFFFGSEQSDPASGIVFSGEDELVVETTARSRNAVYVFLPWVSFILAFISLIFALFAFFS